MGYQTSIASFSNQLTFYLGVIIFNVTLVILRDAISTWRVCFYLIKYDLQDPDVGLKFTEIERKHKIRKSLGIQLKRNDVTKENYKAMVLNLFKFVPRMGACHLYVTDRDANGTF